ncbi:MAG TPA: hypothetical protein VEJ84_15140 [Acidimicrobiales bacterium]|nr:hypothetical protein [Acidimicrobiales bacterium]
MKLSAGLAVLALALGGAASLPSSASAAPSAGVAAGLAPPAASPPSTTTTTAPPVSSASPATAPEYPLSIPPATRQWYGLSNVNDGTGPLINGAINSNTDQLVWHNETFGVNLDWSDDESLWKVQTQGSTSITYGQPVALRVWGGGWLRYGYEFWGVDLQLSSTPLYEWYILGGTPGTPVGNGEFALWNSEANDYMVYGNQTWGVNLNWYKKTLPPGGGGGGTQTGVSLFVAYNCISDEDPVEMWVRDLTAGSGFVDEGELDTAWTDDGSCGPIAGDVWTFAPTSGHAYEVRAVDFSAPGCSNDPTDGQCWVLDATFTGYADGSVVYDEIG